ncbi:MAG: sterol desaturase family protein, partial [Pseudomonadota bacterium]
MPAGIPIEALFAPIFVLSVVIEWWSVKSGHANGRYETADALTSMTMGLGNAIIGTLTGVAALW